MQVTMFFSFLVTDNAEKDEDSSSIGLRPEKRSIQENGDENENGQPKKQKLETDNSNLPTNGTLSTPPHISESDAENIVSYTPECPQQSSPSDSIKEENKVSVVVDLDSSNPESGTKSALHFEALSSSPESDDDDVICLD